MFSQGRIFSGGGRLKGRRGAGSRGAEARLRGEHSDLGALAVKVHDGPDTSRKARGSHAAIPPIHPEPQLPGSRAEDNKNYAAAKGVSGTPGSLIIDTKTGKEQFIGGAQDPYVLMEAIEKLNAEEELAVENKEKSQKS